MPSERRLKAHETDPFAKTFIALVIVAVVGVVFIFGAMRSGPV